MEIRLLAKKILFPGTDIATRKRIRFSRYFESGDILTLDAGCGNGAFSFKTVERGGRVIGIDSDKDKLARCVEFRDYLGISPSRCRFQVNNIYKLSSLNEKFDQIICFETLEHLQDDQKAIHNFSEIMKPGGVIHISTPCSNRKPYYGEILSDKEDGGHVRLGYTFWQLEDMLGKEGFKVIKKDSAVGFLGRRIIGILNRIDSNSLSGGSTSFRDTIRVMMFLILYPLTFLDIIIPCQNLIIYMEAKKLSA